MYKLFPIVSFYVTAVRKEILVDVDVHLTDYEKAETNCSCDKIYQIPKELRNLV